MDKVALVTSTANKRRAMLENELARWLPLLIEHLDPEKIILFGSLTRSKLQEWSDVDLAIVQQTDLSFLKRTRNALLLLRPKVGVDLLIYTPEEFAQLVEERRFVQEEIIKKGQVLYERRS